MEGLVGQLLLKGTALGHVMASEHESRFVVLDHSGSDPQQNWQILMAYPADREVSCKVELIKKTRTFTDCEHRTLFVDQLARPPQGVNVIVARDGKLSLDLRPDSAQPSSPLPPSPPTS